MESSAAKPSTGLARLLPQAIFCLSGVTNNLIGYYIDLRGAGNPLLAYQPFCVVFGQVGMAILLSLCLGGVTKSDFTRPSRISYILLVDLFANATFWAGLTYIGSALCTIVYSSVLIWSAVFSRVLYKKHISFFKWVAIVVILSSLAVSTINQVENDSNSPWLQLLGVGLILSSAVLYGLEYVLGENVLMKNTNPLGGSVFFWPNMLVFAVWASFGTGFGYDKFLGDPVAKAASDAGAVPCAWCIAALYAAFTLSNGIHMVSFMYCLNGGPTSAVAGAVNKSLQSALVFVSSDLLFCPDHSWNQGRQGTNEMTCFTTLKVAGFIGTIVGVFIYSLESKFTKFLFGEKSKPLEAPLLGPDYYSSSTGNSSGITSSSVNFISSS